MVNRILYIFYYFVFNLSNLSFQAIIYGKTDIVNLLIQSGADVNKRAYLYYTPLMWGINATTLRRISDLIIYVLNLSMLL